MKNSRKSLLETIIFCLLCCTLFVLSGYYYLDYEIKKTDKQIEKIPYYEQTAENAGVMLEACGESTFFYLNFSEKKVNVALNPEEKLNDFNKCFAVDYHIITGEDVLEDIVDYLGGVQISLEGKTLRYTGAQVRELAENDKSDEFKKMLISAIFERIAKRGVDVDFFESVIKSSDTNLKIPDCYFWAENFAEISRSINFIY